MFVRVGSVVVCRLVALVLLAVGGAACEERSPRFREAIEVDGTRVAADTMNKGEFAYMRWCRTCHGTEGRGDGPHSTAGSVRPRNLRRGVYKYGSTSKGQLPDDAYFEKLIRRGLPKTGMPPLPVPSQQMGPLIHYVKFLASNDPAPGGEKN